jgi:cytochrome c556
MTQKLLLAAALAAIPLTAAAQTAPGITPEQIVAARQSVMFLSGGDLAAMKAAAEAGGDVKQLVPSARSLARWGRTLPSMFPPGSDGGHAKPEIWSDRAGFEAAAAAFSDAARLLGEAAAAGDRDAFLARWTDVRGACGACHETYKGD